MHIRPAAPAELPLLQAVERAAGESFRPLGMARIADDEPPALDLLARCLRAGHAWVAADPDDRPVASLIHDTVDAAAHIEQVSVHPAASGHGTGRALIDHLAERASTEGLAALTLTTFTDVPWNAPYYARIGFRTLADHELTPGLRKIRAEEAELGLDRWPRVCMRREL
ncbi:MAG TPA: GNAT family N-acetyltransferase [Streptomyces sp.]|nr:GNAT family N-acetyltransferase [Streptomyces sp.]